MVTLIAMLSSGKGTWGQVSSLINSNKWKNIYLICNEFAYKTFEISPNKAIKLQINENNPEEIFEKLSPFFKKQIKDFEVAVNISSGTGAEHMALLSALLKDGLGLRFVYLKDNEVTEFKILEQEYKPQDEDEYFI